MHQLLKLHPDSCHFAAARVEVAVARPRADRLVLSYVVTGRMSDVRMPPAMPAVRTDDLWQHTCFEAFVRGSSGKAYYEFNFAPSTQWAAYRFDSYRSGMRAAQISAPHIDVRPSPDSYTLQATLELDRLPDLSREASWRLGLSALIEDISGGMSYWALAHPPGKPDFHHAGSFALDFSPAVPS
ncbi:MAG: DOMON-like domain-containing protein [Xanthobacteraceae bacterium]